MREDDYERNLQNDTNGRKKEQKISKNQLKSSTPTTIDVFAVRLKVSFGNSF